MGIAMLWVMCWERVDWRVVWLGDMLTDRQ